MRYEFDGKKYEKASAHQKEWGQKLIHEINVSGTEHILDLGCGDGALSAQLAELVPRGKVLGIDASQGMIETAKKYRAGNLRFELMDINQLNFENEFDIVFSNATLHWIKDHDALLEKVRRSLRNDGVLRFNFAGDGNCSHFFNVIRDAMCHPLFKQYFTQYVWPWYMPKTEEYEALVRPFPFRDARVWAENADRFFSDENEMIKWIDQPSLVPFLKHVKDGDKQIFRNWVIERMVQRTCQADGTCFETFRRINVFAKK
jgi:trans-aconitate methyltransferase